MPPARAVPATLLVLVALAAGCGTGRGAEAASADPEHEVDVRLGYLPNLTHAPAIVGHRRGLFDLALGDAARLEVRPFAAARDAVEALYGGRLDVAFLGPNPTINAFAQSRGHAVRIVAGATTGGAALVVRPGIDHADDLAGTRLASPGLGNTQDVALRAWLADGGWRTDATGGGDVAVLPRANADILASFGAGDLDGAWVPEPWASRMVLEGGGHVLVDEASLWPGRRFPTTLVVVRTRFLERHPDVVARLLRGLVDAIDWTNAHPDRARQVTADGIAAVTGSSLSPDVLRRAWAQLAFSWDPLPAALAEARDDAVAVGLLDDVDLRPLFALDLLDQVLAAPTPQGGPPS